MPLYILHLQWKISDAVFQIKYFKIHLLYLHFKKSNIKYIVCAYLMLKIENTLFVRVFYVENKK